MPVTQNFAPLPRRKTERNSTFSDEALLLTDAPVPGMAPQEATRKQEDAQLWIESISDPQLLKSLAVEWQSLADDAAEPNAFYEPWMALPALEHFGKGVELLFAFTSVRGKRLLCGLFPVQQRPGRVELWRYPYCYLSAPLLRRGFERKALAVFLDALAGQTQIARLDDVPGEGPIRRHLIDELNERGWPCVVAASYTRAVLRRAASAEDYLASAVDGKRRKEWRRQRARLAEQGVVVTQELSSSEDPRGFVAELCSLEKAGWKGREGVDASRDQAFLEQMAVSAAREGRQQLLALRLDGKPLALKWNLLAGDGAFAFKITFDEAFARFSPGVQLELENVERAHLLPRLRWMDSCAAPNRFMINHLWPDRREMQRLFIGTGGKLGELAVAAVPLLKFVRGCVRRHP
ncbi:MAG TPA: GNAT family N-acetyltransferase [Myxococcales bacterium]|jgi:CelD/BcsL family acetyltransferase involved in cellulose biosynthesis|nr:GNAT family N-acetyltransferase [Myxococcales bacterium]